MKTSSVRKVLILFIACLLAIMVCSASLSEEYSAQTMRLMHYEGNVEIIDANGSPRFVMENVRFSSGETMRTAADSRVIDVEKTEREEEPEGTETDE